MNMNELVNNIFSAQETQGMVSEGWKKQDSITLPRLLSQKTVDEVWKYITEEEHTNSHGGGTNIPQIHQSQQTLGETTLQEFLIRAGVEGNSNNSGYIHDTSLGMQYQPKEKVSDLMNNIVSRSHDSNLHQNVNRNMVTYQPRQPIIPKPNGNAYGKQIGYSNGFMTIGEQSLQEKKRSLVPNVATIPGGGMACSSITPSPIFDGIQKINGESSLISPSSYIFSGGNSARCRKNNNIIAAENNLVDKRQRRKIKNRESAVRSRARKQAQTMELEVELENLKKQNQELLKLQAEMRKRPTQSGIINLQGQPETKLRRTKSDIN
ncbi:ABSCISIC ACID-INSENSITIVE 5-like protein 8 [Cardamine amara subsp. amara]|uniref:ABSCISIC ACID-INSENSITIVE 5-like protein 8 n=1 Tax=Cardamine amara subsp. amara TaxID=228776 RepID=A0ABD1A6K7_CARAN